MGKMVEVPWIDNTIRMVEEGTPVLVHYPDPLNNAVRFAMEGGYSSASGAQTFTYTWNDVKAVAIYAETDEPPIKVELPTNLGAVVVDNLNRPVYVRKFVKAAYPWYDIECAELCSDEEVIQFISESGYKVAFEGVADND